MNSIRSRLDEFLHRKDNILTQLVKYAFCGGVAVAVDQITFYLLAWLVLPALRLTDPVAQLLTKLGLTVQHVSEADLQKNFWMIKIICFILSNTVVYILNIKFVFQSGRHSRAIEVGMFFGFSLLQFVYIWIASLLITQFNWEVTYANLTMLMLGILTTYFIRKKIVFKH